ncbi:DUF6177 family protein [Streptomyces sp. NPDC002754]
MPNSAKHPVTRRARRSCPRRIGLAHARRPPLALKPVQLGPATSPALHYPLGDGTDPTAWTTLRHLTAHLNDRTHKAG